MPGHATTTDTTRERKMTPIVLETQWERTGGHGNGNKAGHTRYIRFFSFFSPLTNYTLPTTAIPPIPPLQNTKDMPTRACPLCSLTSFFLNSKSAPKKVRFCYSSPYLPSRHITPNPPPSSRPHRT